MTEYAPLELDRDTEALATIAAIWTAILGIEISAEQVQRCQVAAVAAVGLDTERLNTLWLVS